MAQSGGARSFGATIVGWLIVALVAYFAFGFLIGTLRWIIRLVIVVFLIGALLTVYFKLRDGD